MREAPVAREERRYEEIPPTFQLRHLFKQSRTPTLATRSPSEEEREAFIQKVLPVSPRQPGTAALLLP